MLIHHLRKNVMGAGGSAVYGGNKRATVAKPHKRVVGNGLSPEVYTTEASKPTRVLQNIQIRRSSLPKKYITFE